MFNWVANFLDMALNPHEFLINPKKPQGFTETCLFGPFGVVVDSSVLYRSFKFQRISRDFISALVDVGAARRSARVRTPPRHLPALLLRLPQNASAEVALRQPA